MKLDEQEHLRQIFDQLGFVTTSAALLPLLQRARKAAEVSDVTVLLDGETGTGKQVLALGIHQLDQKRRGFPFITVHCSTITEALAESELFGHHRGSFSGAVADRKGLFQAAHHGTVLLDDVNDLPMPLQAKLLDVMQRGVIRAVGSDREIKIDVRVIAACNQPLEPLVRQGRFRGDLYHRLNVVKLCLPPLRQRLDDLEPLMLAFAKRHDHLFGPIESVDADLLGHLSCYAFPGNVRELENAVQRMLFLKSAGRSFHLSDWLAQAGENEPATDSNALLEAAARNIWAAISQRGLSYQEAMQEIERRVLQTAMAASGRTRSELARHLNTSERTLYYRMRAHGLGSRVTARLGAATSCSS